MLQVPEFLLGGIDLVEFFLNICRLLLKPPDLLYSPKGVEFLLHLPQFRFMGILPGIVVFLGSPQFHVCFGLKIDFFVLFFFDVPSHIIDLFSTSIYCAKIICDLLFGCLDLLEILFLLDLLAFKSGAFITFPFKVGNSGPGVFEGSFF